MKAIYTKYIGPNTKGSRVKAYDSDGNSCTIPYRSEFNSDQNHAKAMVALCQKMGWSGRYVAANSPDGKGYVFVDIDGYPKVNIDKGNAGAVTIET